MFLFSRLVFVAIAWLFALFCNYIVCTYYLLRKIFLRALPHSSDFIFIIWTKNSMNIRWLYSKLQLQTHSAKKNEFAKIYWRTSMLAIKWMGYELWMLLGMCKNVNFCAYIIINSAKIYNFTIFEGLVKNKLAKYVVFSVWCVIKIQFWGDFSEYAINLFNHIISKNPTVD